MGQAVAGETSSQRGGRRSAAAAREDLSATADRPGGGFPEAPGMPCPLAGLPACDRRGLSPRSLVVARCRAGEPPVEAPPIVTSVHGTHPLQMPPAPAGRLGGVPGYGR